MIGLGIRQSQRLWQQYRKVELDEFIKSRYEGRRNKLSAAEKVRLEERLKEDDVLSLQKAQEYLAQEFGVNYTIGGVSYLFQQMKVKLKTGRPRNYQQKEEEIAVFTKNAGLS